MLPILLLLIFSVLEIRSECYVPNNVCTQKILGLSLVKNNCNVRCEVQNEDTCEAVSYFEGDIDDHSTVLLSATAAEGGAKFVYFNATLLEHNWELFKVNIYSYDPTLSICRTYKNNGRVSKMNPKTNFQFIIYEENEYEELENKEVVVQYEIKRKDQINSSYGKLIFIAPAFKRFAKPPTYAMELFNYIDNTEREILKLNVQPAESEYKIPNYDIEVWRSKDTRVEKVNPPVGPHGQIFYAYNATDKKGTYFFVISPNTTACGKLLYKTKSAVIDLDRAYTLTAIILYSILLFIFLVGGTFLCFRRECACCRCQCKS